MHDTTGDHTVSCKLRRARNRHRHSRSLNLSLVPRRSLYIHQPFLPGLVQYAVLLEASGGRQAWPEGTLSMCTHALIAGRYACSDSECRSAVRFTRGCAASAGQRTNSQLRGLACTKHLCATKTISMATFSFLSMKETRHFRCQSGHRPACQWLAVSPDCSGVAIGCI